MGQKAIVRLGDSTSHGGKVIEGYMDNISMGKPIAGVGHKVTCPQCKGTFPIVPSPLFFQIMGVAIAVDGMMTACGAKLIASQFTDFVEAGGGGAPPAAGTAAP